MVIWSIVEVISMPCWPSTNRAWVLSESSSVMEAPSETVQPGRLWSRGRAGNWGCQGWYLGRASLLEDSLELVLAERITPGLPQTRPCTGSNLDRLAALLV